MHGRIASARVRPGTAAEVAAAWESLLEAYRDTGAFRGMVSLHQADDDLAVTLTFWDSAAAADAVVEPLRARASEAFAGLLLEAPTITAYDVLLTELSGMGGTRG